MEYEEIKISHDEVKPSKCNHVMLVNELITSICDIKNIAITKFDLNLIGVKFDDIEEEKTDCHINDIKEIVHVIVERNTLDAISFNVKSENSLARFLTFLNSIYSINCQMNGTSYGLFRQQFSILYREAFIEAEEKITYDTDSINNILESHNLSFKIIRKTFPSGNIVFKLINTKEDPNKINDIYSDDEKMFIITENDMLDYIQQNSYNYLTEEYIKDQFIKTFIIIYKGIYGIDNCVINLESKFELDAKIDLLNNIFVYHKYPYKIKKVINRLRRKPLNSDDKYIIEGIKD